MQVVPWEEARRTALAAARPLAAAPVPLPEAYGCRLAEPLRALVAVPGVDVAAMDGFAVAGPAPWRVVGRVLAGGLPYGGRLRAGEAVEIATGAPVPEGALAVLPYEEAHAEERPRPDHVPPPSRTGEAGEPGGGGERVPGEAPERWVEPLDEHDLQAGRHIRRRGEDIPQGEAVLGAGATVTPAVLGLAAALGHDTLAVWPRPAVSVLVTGDEVVHEGLPGPGRVRDAIGPVLPGLIEWAGGRVAATAFLPDGADPLRRALHDARADVVVVCGASSRGPADHLRSVLAELDAHVMIDGVAVRPGHPQLLARLGGGLVVGLLGNPFAALGAALTLLAPILRRMAHRDEPYETSTLAGPVRTHPHDTRLVPVRRSAGGAVPVGHDRPGSLWGAALADALAVVPPGWDGGHVELLPLPMGV
ncbi:molybdopterin molybdotransferase MoeA [Thermoactinospora rubra]|uniref:molybdopterin molybdotransferase MoeA n=1 Tax=Thermoactinospora rubra TaxID=1088767 RepID=UPI001F0B449F|nr:molybdopterin molybdotransferase MoeA [Thermoactinospora rubra]